MMVDDHHVVHVVHLFMSIKPRSTNRIDLGFMNFDESPINEPNTTLKLGHMLGKSCRPSNLVTNCLINVGSDKNCIITYNTFALVPHDDIIHDYIIMFHI